MSELKIQCENEQAKTEIHEVLHQIEMEREAINSKYKDEKGLDRGAKEHRASIRRGMEKIAKIRKKYNLPEPNGK